MPRISHENKEFYKAKIRSLLAIDHSMSQRELQSQLEENGVHLHRDYIAKLERQVMKERATRADRKTLNFALGVIEDTLTETNRIAWQISLNTTAKRSERLIALRKIDKAHFDLFNLLFDAGVFDRKLGSVEHTIRNAPLSQERKAAIRSAFEKWGLIQEQKSDADGNAAKPENER